MDQSYSFDHLGARLNRAICLLGQGIVPAESQSISLLDQAPVHHFFGLVGLPDEVDLPIVNVQTVFVVSADLEESRLPVDLTHQIFNEIVISSQV